MANEFGGGGLPAPTGRSPFRAGPYYPAIAALGGFVLFWRLEMAETPITRDNSILSRITIFADERSSTCF